MPAALSLEPGRDAVPGDQAPKRRALDELMKGRTVAVTGDYLAGSAVSS